ncbi:MAG TPA: hypothetical protein VHP31_08340 [Caproicibacter sp.]|nr:hypothetical protein [Caproicibacter sp.]
MAAIRSFRNDVDRMLHGNFWTVSVMFVTVAPELFNSNPSILDLMVMLPEQSARWVSHRDEKSTGWCHAVY